MPFLAAIPIAVSAAIGAGTTIAGTVISAVGQHKSGNAADEAAHINADRAIEEAGIREQQQRTQDRSILARAKSIVGVSGVTMQGSPLDVMAESARQAEQNALIIRRGGELEAQSQIYAGKAAKTASNYGVAGTILTGAASVINNIPSFGGNKSKKTVLGA